MKLCSLSSTSSTNKQEVNYCETDGEPSRSDDRVLEDIRQPLRDENDARHQVDEEHERIHVDARRCVEIVEDCLDAGLCQQVGLLEAAVLCRHVQRRAAVGLLGCR